jgi:hypothetical protein
MSSVKHIKVDENNIIDTNMIDNDSLFMILSKLNNKQLFKIKTVNKQFYNVINKIGSLIKMDYIGIIQHRLYLKVDENDKFKEWVNENNDKIFSEIISYDRNFIKLLINNGANKWNDCLLLCTKDNYIDIAELCIENGANNIKEAIIMACLLGNMDFVKTFVDSCLEGLGDYIDRACSNNYYNLVKYLLTKKSSQEFNYKKHFISSLNSDNINLVKLFEELLTLDNIVKDCDELFVRICCSYNINIVTYFVDKYKDHIRNYDIFNEVFEIGFIPYYSFHAARDMIKPKENDIYQIVNLLITNGAKKFDKCVKFSCKFNLVSVINLLINKGMNKFNYGLVCAAKNNDIEICKIMIKNGANKLNIILERYLSMFEIHFNIVKLLIKNGANNIIYCIKKINHIDSEVEELFNYLINNKIVNEKFILILICNENFHIFPNNANFIWKMIYKNAMNESSKEEWNLVLNKVKETKDHNLIKLCESYVKN